MTDDIVCYIDRIPGYDAWGIWFHNRRDGAVAVVQAGELVWQPQDEVGVQVPPTLTLNGRWEAPALLAALENTPTATVWKARYEEVVTQLELAEGRVDRIIDKAING